MSVEPLIDEIVPEPLGGCHRDRDKTAAALKNTLKRTLEELRRIPVDQLLSSRYQRLLSYGVFEEGNA